MQVLKFGGTSVGTPQRMRQVAALIQGESPCIVVLSALSGTTNQLVHLAALLRSGSGPEIGEQLAALREAYEVFIYDLFTERGDRRRARGILDDQFGALERASDLSFTPETEKLVLAQGELLSTRLFQLYLETQGVTAALIPALDYLRLDANGEPDLTFLRQELPRRLAEQAGVQMFITQGYICRNHRGAIDNLQRGGSDYTATLIGAALNADEIQIWTDIDGIHNNDPRVVAHTYPVRRISYREAAELAYFGAKILHPTCVLPAEQRGVPIRLKNTFAPETPGTMISAASSGHAITAIAAKDGITAIKIRSHRMLMAYGFLRRVFEVFEDYRTPIDMITTSEVAISLTIDDATHLEAIVNDLGAFGEVSVEAEQSIICIVGDNLHEQVGYARKIFTALAEVPIRMVSYGGSNNNISLLIKSSYKEAALQALNRQVFPALAEVYA